MSKPAATDKPTMTITDAELRVGDRITRLGYVPNPGVRVVHSVRRVDEADPDSWVRYTFTVEGHPEQGLLRASGAPHGELEIEVR